MDNLSYLRLLDAIHNRLRTLRLPYAGSFVRRSSITDHDHDALAVSYTHLYELDFSESTL